MRGELEIRMSKFETQSLTMVLVRGCFPTKSVEEDANHIERREIA